MIFGECDAPGIALKRGDYLHDQCHSNTGNYAGLKAEVIAQEIDLLLRGDVESGDVLDLEAGGD